MSDFDPDAYLAAKQAEEPFDPDKYLAAKKPMSGLESLQHGLEQGTSFGLGDEAQGALEAIGQSVGLKGLGAARHLNEWDFQTPNGFDAEKFAKVYRETRDKERSTAHQAKESNPAMYGGGEIVGGVLSPVSKLAKAGTLAQAAATGAGFGGLAGFGNSEANSALDLAKDAAVGAGVGGAFGGLGYEASKAIEKASPIVGRKLKDVAEQKAFKSSGAMLKDFRTAEQRGQVNDIGRFMLDNGLVKAGDTFDDVALKAAEFNKGAGGRLDDIYRQAIEKFGEDARSVGFDPVRDKENIMSAARSALGDDVNASGALGKLSKYLDDIAEKYAPTGPTLAQQKYQAEVKNYLPRFRQFVKDRVAYRKALGAAGNDIDQPAITGLIDDLQARTMKPRQIELLGKQPQNMSAAPPEPLTQQPFLPDLPTGNSEAQRLFAQAGDANFGDLGGDAATRIGKRATDALAPPAQLEFLNQNTAEQLSMFGKQGEILGTGLTPRSYVQVSNPVMEQGAGQLSMLFPPQAPLRPVAPNMRQALDPRTMNNIKSSIDEAINYARNPLTREPATEKALYAARKALSQQIDQSIENLGGADALSSLKAANRDYGISKQVERMATDRMNREAANRAFGLTDTISGGAGATIGGFLAGPLGVPIGGAVGAGANKLGRTYGSAIAADTADRVSKFLLRSPQIQNLAQKNPAAFEAMVLDFTRRTTSPTQAFPKAAGGELDRDSSTPAQYKVPPENARKQFIDGN